MKLEDIEINCPKCNASLVDADGETNDDNLTVILTCPDCKTMLRCEMIVEFKINVCDELP